MLEKLSIDETIDLARSMDQTILALIERFETRTGLTVQGIELDHVRQLSSSKPYVRTMSVRSRIEVR